MTKCTTGIWMSGDRCTFTARWPNCALCGVCELPVSPGTPTREPTREPSLGAKATVFS